MRATFLFAHNAHQAGCALTFVLAAAVFLVSCSKEKQLQPVIQVVRAGVVGQIEPGADGAPPQRYSASIEPIQKVDLAFKSGGIVAQIRQVRGADGRMRNVDIGDKVPSGAELAQVRPADYENSLAQAEAQHGQAQAQVTQAQAQLTQAQANFHQADLEYARDSNLFQSGSLIKPTYDQAKAQYDAGAASVAAAEQAVKAAESTVGNTSAGVSQAKLSLSDTALCAPFAGWITARNVDRGSLVGASTVGFSIEDTHLVKASFGVPDTTLPLIHLGQKEPVALDILQRAVPGVITSISPQADSTSRVFSIEVTLDNSREDIRPGMIGTITLGGPRDSTRRLAVPLSAVVRAPNDPTGFAVFRITESDGKLYASAQPIEIGQTFGNSIEVMRGLAAGQRIIWMGAAQVHDGQQVSILP